MVKIKWDNAHESLLCAVERVTSDMNNNIFPVACFVIPKLWLQPTKEKRLRVLHVLSLESRPLSGKPAPPLGLLRTTPSNPQDRRRLEEGSERSPFLGVLSVVGAHGGGRGRCMGEGVSLFSGWISALPWCLLIRSGLCDREEAWREPLVPSWCPHSRAYRRCNLSRCSDPEARQNGSISLPGCRVAQRGSPDGVKWPTRGDQATRSRCCELLRGAVWGYVFCQQGLATTN